MLYDSLAGQLCVQGFGFGFRVGGFGGLSTEHFSFQLVGCLLACLWCVGCSLFCYLGALEPVGPASLFGSLGSL